VESIIVGFHCDEHGDWVAELACGHGQHMRHDPPWQSRPWTVTAAGRASRLGEKVHCRKCERGEPRADWSKPGGRAAGPGPAPDRAPEE
jgi:hypothetical protein